MSVGPINLTADEARALIRTRVEKGYRPGTPNWADTESARAKVIAALRRHEARLPKPRDER